MLQINAQRLLDDLKALSQIGQLPVEVGGGIDRAPFSHAERAARTFFAERARAAGLDVQTDGAANLSARLSSRHATQTILTGSHLDSVPHGGPYDGALGVIGALEVLRTIQEAGLKLAYDLEAIAFTDEEGRYGDLTGSRGLAGALSVLDIEEFLAAVAPDDLAAVQPLVPGALSVEGILSARRDLQRIAAYVELHIEQGPQLEHVGINIGLVEAIFGRRAYALSFEGRSDHAGTTPLPLRADAMMAAAHLMTQAHTLVRERFPRAVLTFGNLQVQPGVYNVVPNHVELWVEFRAADESTMAEIDQSIHDLAAQVAPSTKTRHEFHPSGQLRPVSMHPQVQGAIVKACERLGLAYHRLASGALHDTNSLAEHVPTGMIFVPSIGGRSHCPEEMTGPGDLVAGVNVLLHTVLSLAGH